MAPTASTAVPVDPGVVTAQAQGAFDATLQVVVESVAADRFFAQYRLADLVAAGPTIQVVVGKDPAQPDRLLAVAVDADPIAMVRALTQTQGNQLDYDAGTDGTLVSLRSRRVGSAGTLSLRPPGGQPITAVDVETAPDAVMKVNQVAVAALGNTCAPAQGLTLTALKPGTTTVIVGSGSPPNRMPGAILLIALLWLAVLALFGLQYPHISIRLFGLHSEQHAAHLLSWHVPRQMGPVPSPVPWFAAVGGLLISFEGIFTYNRHWDPSYNYWHLLRPVVGAFAGTMAVFLLLVVINAADATSDANLLKAAADSQSRRILFEVIAFITGYREETFRALIKKVVDVILGPGSSDTTAAGSPNTPKQ